MGRILFTGTWYHVQASFANLVFYLAPLITSFHSQIAIAVTERPT
jgi:hypothetical protein